MTSALPRPTDAFEVNERGFLRGRAQTCAEARSSLPNLLALDFVGQGGLFKVVDELNGTAGP